MTLRSSSLCCLKFGKAWLEGSMDDTVGRLCDGTQVVHIVHVAAKDLRPRRVSLSVPESERRSPTT